MTSSPAAVLADFGSMLADATRAEVLCALMDGRAHTGSELARHVGVAPSTMSEHLSKLHDAGMVTVEPQGRHRYFRLANAELAEILESLGATATGPSGPRAPADLAHARTCYDHLAGALAVEIYSGLVAAGHLVEEPTHVALTPSGLELFASVGADLDAAAASKRPMARACLDWTQRRHHLAGSAGRALLDAFLADGWMRRGTRPRSLRVTELGRREIPRRFCLGSGSPIASSQSDQ